MSDYLKVRNAWLDDLCSYSEADKRSPEFRAGYNNAGKMYPNRRPKITVRSKMEMRNDKSMIQCNSCKTKFHTDELLFDENFMSDSRCLKCNAEIPIKFGSNEKK